MGHGPQLKSLFEAALEQSAEQREEFLDRACPDDDEVRQEALRLLREHDGLEVEFLEPPGKQTLLDRAARSLASDPPARCPGEVLAERYVIEREIARGGSGVVYLARDRQLHSRPVVVKFPHVGWEEHARLKARFLLEIEALSRIRHSGVVGVLDVGQAPDGRSFLVMEYVEGATLRSLLEEGTVALPQAAEIVDMVAEALDAAHQCGILHRDLKPENIMLEQGGEGRTIVKLIDFGIARVQYEEPGSQTETVTILGTVRYVAPEQLMGRSEPRSDIYALGVLCYEMLTGHRPFEPVTPFQLYELQRAGKVTPPSRLRRDIPKRVDHAILRALSFRPEGRQSSAREFAAEFRREGRRRMPPLRKWLPAGVVSAGLFLTAAGGWQWTQGEWGSYEHVIQTAAGHNPEEGGFQKRLDLVERAVYNQERTGIDAIRLLSGDQGFYYHKLTRAQAYSAMRNGWSAAATLRPAQGSGALDIDLTPASHRYGLNVFLNPSGRQVVQLTARIADGIEGPRYEIEGPGDAYHDYQLIFDPGTREARLLVDGVERLRGYRGHSEYLEGWGVIFGAALYRSEKAEALFKRVRFEIAEPRP